MLMHNFQKISELFLTNEILQTSPLSFSPPISKENYFPKWPVVTVGVSPGPEQTHQIPATVPLPL